MLQWGLVLPSFPIPSPLTLSLAVLAWEELAASEEFCPTDWEQARAFDEEEVCMDSPPTGHVCIMQTQPDGFFFLLGHCSQLTSPQSRSSAAEPASVAAWRWHGSESRRWCQPDPAGWVKWLNVLPVPGRCSLGKLCLLSLCLLPIPVPPIPTKHWAPLGLGVSTFPPLLRRAGTVLSTWANADTQ